MEGLLRGASGLRTNGSQEAPVARQVVTDSLLLGQIQGAGVDLPSIGLPCAAKAQILVLKADSITIRPWGAGSQTVTIDFPCRFVPDSHLHY